MPPVNKVTFLIQLSSLIIKSMSDLMTNHPANSSIVHVLGSVTVEEDTLEDASWELY